MTDYWEKVRTDNEQTNERTNGRTDMGQSIGPTFKVGGSKKKKKINNTPTFARSLKKRNERDSIQKNNQSWSRFLHRGNGQCKDCWMRWISTLPESKYSCRRYAGELLKETKSDDSIVLLIFLIWKFISENLKKNREILTLQNGQKIKGWGPQTSRQAWHGLNDRPIDWKNTDDHNQKHKKHDVVLSLFAEDLKRTFRLAVPRQYQYVLQHFSGQSRQMSATAWKVGDILPSSVGGPR